MYSKKQNTNLVRLRIHLVETFALIPNSKIIFTRSFFTQSYRY